MGKVLIALLSSYFFEWKIIQIVFMTFPLIYLYFKQYIWFESPRYLQVKKRFDEASDSLKEIAKINERPIENF